MVQRARRNADGIRFIASPLAYPEGDYQAAANWVKEQTRHANGHGEHRVIVGAGGLQTAAEVFAAFEDGCQALYDAHHQKPLHDVVKALFKAGVCADDPDLFMRGFENEQGLEHALSRPAARINPRISSPNFVNFVLQWQQPLSEIGYRILGATDTPDTPRPRENIERARANAQGYVFHAHHANIPSIRRFFEELRQHLVNPRLDDRPIYVIAPPHSRIWQAIEKYLNSGIASEYPNRRYLDSIRVVSSEVELQKELGIAMSYGATDFTEVPYLTFTSNATKMAEVFNIAPAGKRFWTLQELKAFYPRIIDNKGNHIHESPETEGSHAEIVKEKLRVAVKDLKADPKAFERAFPNGVVVFTIDLGLTTEFLTPKTSRFWLNGWDCLTALGIEFETDPRRFEKHHTPKSVLLGDGFDPQFTDFPGIYVGPVTKALKAHYRAQNFADAWEHFLGDKTPIFHNGHSVNSALQALYQEKQDPRAFGVYQTGVLSSAYLRSENGHVVEYHDPMLDTMNLATRHTHHYVPDFLRDRSGTIRVPDGVHEFSAFLFDETDKGMVSHVHTSRKSITQRNATCMLDRWEHTFADEQRAAAKGQEGPLKQMMHEEEGESSRRRRG